MLTVHSIKSLIMFYAQQYDERIIIHEFSILVDNIAHFVKFSDFPMINLPFLTLALLFAIR